MKAVVLGDTHFGGGYSLGKPHPSLKVNSRLIDYINTFDYVIDYMVRNSIGLLIITGDVFDFRRPQAYELAAFSNKVKKCSDLNIEIHIVIGNHDLLLEQNATTVDVINNLELPNVKIHYDIESFSTNNNGHMNFLFIPYRTKNMLSCSTNDEAVDKLKDIVRYEMNKFSEGDNIVVGHMMFQGTKLGNMVLDGNGSEVVVSQEIFEDFDCVIMGHVHPFQIIREDPLMAYVGSMERKEFSDLTLPKLFAVLDNNNGKELSVNFERLPVRQLFDIEIDKSDIEDGEDLFESLKESIQEHEEERSIKDGIVRITIYVKDSALVSFDKMEFKKFLYKDYKINYCVGIHTQVTSHRQLRKSTITERSTPLNSFYEFLELENDEELREKMKIIGTKIITELE